MYGDLGDGLWHCFTICPHDHDMFRFFPFQIGRSKVAIFFHTPPSPLRQCPAVLRLNLIGGTARKHCLRQCGVMAGDLLRIYPLMSLKPWLGNVRTKWPTETQMEKNILKWKMVHCHDFQRACLSRSCCSRRLITLGRSRSCVRPPSWICKPVGQW